jgi:Transglutaminase-like superfamily
MTQSGPTISEVHESISNSASDEQRRSLEFCLRPAMMTDAGADAGAFGELPSDIASLVRIVQGLLLHEHLIPAYGLELPDERRRESQIRRVELMLRSLLARDGKPLSMARPVGERLVGVCRHFTVLLVSMLRAKGVPARARCGFGGYFVPGRCEDHWVCEYWNSGRQQWILVDAQIDAVQKDMFKPHSISSTFRATNF